MILNEVTCCNCGIVFGIGSQRASDLRASHEWFYCPSGHAQWYTGETEAERQEARADKLAERLDHVRSERQAVERRLLTACQQHGKTKAKLRRVEEG